MSHFDAEGDRVLADLYAWRQIGGYKSGVHRPSLSAVHLEATRWLERALAQNGLTPAVDGIGHIIGSSGRRKALLAGSHLESQNHAGWLDRPLGVISASFMHSWRRACSTPCSSLRARGCWQRDGIARDNCFRPRTVCDKCSPD